MTGRTHLLAAALAVGLTAGVALAAPRLAPLPRDEAVSTHSPFEMGECRACHARNDPRNPGPVSKAAAQLCADCHDDFSGTRKGHPTRGSCTTCHSPHNARRPKLLL